MWFFLRQPSLIIFAFLLFAPAIQFAQQHENLALRGFWETRTPYDRVTLDFTSDSTLDFYGEVVAYQLLPGIIRITGDGVTTDYRYIRHRSCLTVLFPDDSKRVFQRTRLAPLERSISGRYCGSSGVCALGDWLEFDGDHGFMRQSIHMLPHGNIAGPAVEATATQVANRANGTYFMEGSSIMLTFWNGETAIAHVTRWDQRGMVAELTYDERTFTILSQPAEEIEAGTDLDAFAYLVDEPPIPVSSQIEHSGSTITASNALDILSALFDLVSLVSPTPKEPAASVSQSPAASTTEAPAGEKRDSPSSRRNFGRSREGQRRP